MRRVERGLIVALAQPVIVESVMENVGDELRHGAAAGAVREIDPTVCEVEFPPVRLCEFLRDVHEAALCPTPAAASSRNRP